VIDLKQFRKSIKKSQGDIAIAIGVGASRISRYESGKELSNSITERILEKYPDAKNYIVDKLPEEGGVLAFEDYKSEKDEEIKYLREMNMELIRLLKDQNKMTEAMKELRDKVE